MTARHDIAQTPPAQRMLAPDLARGAMLLLIVLAHAPLYLTGVESGVLGHPAGGSILDQIVRSITILAVDSRAYPMFAALFGYGIVMIITKQQKRDGGDSSQARRLLRRRGWWLVALGFVHAMLVTPIEILGAYGVAALVLGWVFFRKGRALLISAAVLSIWFLIAITSFSILENLPMEETGGDIEAFSPAQMGYGPGDLIERLVIWLIAVITNNLLFPIVIAMLLGGWAAKRRVLENPVRNRRLLRGVASIGVAIAVCGAVPMVLIDLGGLSADLSWLAQSLHVISGVFGGLAYTAFFGLLGARLQDGQRRDQQHPAIGLLAAVGQRSLTCYLLQSALLVIILSQTFLGLGANLNSAGAALAAGVAWLGGVVAAGLLERAGRSGPAEALLRRMVYRRRKSTTP